MNGSLVISNIGLSIFALAFVVGCASTEHSSNSRRYTQGVTSTSVTKVDKKICPSLTKIKKRKNWKILVKEANSCATAKKWSRVEKLGSILAESAIDSPWGGYYLSLAAEGRGQYDRAFWMIEIALTKAPKQGILMFQKGRLLWQKGEKESAVSLIHAALDRDNTLNPARLFLAQVELRDQQYSRAFELFTQAKKVNPNNPLVHLGLAECLIVRENWLQAVEHLDKASSIDRARMDIRLKRAWILESKLESTALALEAYRKIRYLKLKNRLTGALPKDIGEKISKLEAQLLAQSKKKKISKRNPASIGKVAK